jgi:hypothetical protein
MKSIILTIKANNMRQLNQIRIDLKIEFFSDEIPDHFGLLDHIANKMDNREYEQLPGGNPMDKTVNIINYWSAEGSVLHGAIFI